MKSKILLVTLFLFGAMNFAQEIKIPAKVKEAFNKLYSKATEIKWSKENKYEFEAEFKDQGNFASAVINSEGKLLETETAITKTELPKGVEAFIVNKYKGWNLTESTKMVNSKGIVTFEAEITKGKEKKDLIFSSDGKPIVTSTT